MMMENSQVAEIRSLKNTQTSRLQSFVQQWLLFFINVFTVFCHNTSDVLLSIGESVNVILRYSSLPLECLRLEKLYFTKWAVHYLSSKSWSDTYSSLQNEQYDEYTESVNLIILLTC